MLDFEQAMNEVLEWNEIARDSPPTEEQQEKIVREEIKEHFDAVKAKSSYLRTRHE